MKQRRRNPDSGVGLWSYGLRSGETEQTPTSRDSGIRGDASLNAEAPAAPIFRSTFGTPRHG